MKLLPSGFKQWLWFLPLLASLSAGVAFYAIDEPQHAHADAYPESPWQLPRFPERTNFKLLYEQLQKLAPWGNETIKHADSVTLKAVAGRILGIISEGGESIALVQDSENKISRYRIGDTLPQQGKITAIQGDHIVVEHAGEEYNLHLYGQMPPLP